jgi:hypothetical protein
MPAGAVSLTATYKDAHYVLTVTNGSGSGSYIYNQQVTITANPAATGKAFDRWTGDIIYLSSAVTSPAAIVIMPAGSVSLTATYKDVYYPLTVTNGSGSGSYLYNQAVTIGQYCSYR